MTEFYRANPRRIARAARTVSAESLDNLILRARRMRAEATAELLSRLGAALVRPFRRWTASNAAGAHTVIKGGPQRAV